MEIDLPWYAKHTTPSGTQPDCTLFLQAWGRIDLGWEEVVLDLATRISSSLEQQVASERSVPA